MDSEIEIIHSRANQHLKRVGAVRSGKERDVILLEGERLIADALRSGHSLDLLLIAADRPDLMNLIESNVERSLMVDPPLLARTSGLEHSPGILALMRPPKPIALSKLLGPHAELILVVAGVADPGNLGALSRSAEAAGAAGMIVLEGGVRPWNEKAMRGSMGSLLRLPVCHAVPAADAAKALDVSGYRQVAAATRGGTDYRRFDWTGPLAIWVAPETGHAPAECDAFEGVSIPMAGGVESLNVSIAASLLLFAAASNQSQRGKRSGVQDA
ncbi:MAG: TrmH family RNA methyltransferase [Planctomycetota bacterium]|jgi:TrmH family RNA methyltransferase